MFTNKVAIIGCGPSGLIAAHACVGAGITPDIYSKEIVKSKLGGAQYLHSQIPGLGVSSRAVNYIKFGTQEIYALKVYNNSTQNTSWNTYKEGYHPAWNLIEAYDILWDLYQAHINELEIDSITLPHLIDNYQLVINTAPKKTLCQTDHQFTSQRILIRKEAQCKPMTIVYDGTYKVHWYRQSNLFGVKFTEYPANPRSTGTIIKPLLNDCDCWPELFNVGRFGAWDKQQLVDKVFTSVIGKLDEMF